MRRAPRRRRRRRLCAAAGASTSLKITGIDVFSAGALDAADDARERSCCTTPSAASTRSWCCATTGSSARVLYGERRRRPLVLRADARQGATSSAIRDQLVFGRAFAEAAGASTPATDVAAMADGERGLRLQRRRARARSAGAIRDKGLTTLDAVRAHTKASASCGSCTAPGRGDPGARRRRRRLPAPQTPSRSATAPTHGHDEVRRAIVDERAEDDRRRCMQALGWKTPDGCPTCRPALNYYLLCAWPGRATATIRNRASSTSASHANIQKDGTYSVVPRMWGGLTNAARAARASPTSPTSTAIPTVKVTGGQRIDLLGVKKEDLPAVWADLNAAGLVSGHAYAKALRTVKTCVGSEWCRFGTQDSTGLGVKLEKMCWGVVDARTRSSSRSRAARATAPRRRSRMSAWSASMPARRSSSAAMAGSRSASPILWRGSRPRPRCWNMSAPSCSSTARRRAISNAPRRGSRGSASTTSEAASSRTPTGRRALHARFLFSQRFVQNDPWAERAAGAAAHEYRAAGRRSE